MKRYTRQDLNIVSDAVSLIQKDPSRYLGRAEKAPGEDLAARMMSSLIWLGALPATVTRLPPWWVVSSEKDWLAVAGQANVEAAFSTIVPLPAAGPNSHRAEVLLSAFADVVVTLGADGVRWVKGDSSRLTLPQGVDLAHANGGRIVAFSCEDSADR
jgi:hypothetical protein